MLSLFTQPPLKNVSNQTVGYFHSIYYHFIYLFNIMEVSGYSYKSPLSPCKACWELQFQLLYVTIKKYFSGSH